MKKNSLPIAIIGLSGKFPKANDIQKLRSNLLNGIDSVTEISEDRIQKTTIDKKDYQIAGFLDDIDCFDYELFNFAPIEAKTMDPTLRILIQESFKCFESSGRAPTSFKGTNTVVISTYTQLNYYLHADEFEPSLVTGNSPEFLSAAISRQFGLRGNSLVVNTSCSSSLAAIEVGCLYLESLQADYVLIASANIFLFPFEKEDNSLELNSPSGKSKSFSEEADGMSFGECVGTILIKRLDDAIRDKDMIYSIIKGIGSNHNGDISAGPTKPDSQVQKELLLKVWENANINPRKIGYIEAHGSGTKLGDFLEIKAISDAFNITTQDKSFCSISTIKSNIGHCREASGIAGLFKAILSVRYGELYPILNFAMPSKIIDFENSATFIQQNSENWYTEDNDPRLAGISAMGISGTNYHMIIQETPKFTSCSSENSPYLILLSANNVDALVTQKNKLQEYCKEFPNLNQLSSTLIKGKNHYKFRWSKLINTLDELELELGKEFNITNSNEITKLYIISMPNEISESQISFFVKKYKVFKEIFYKIIGNENIDPNQYLTQFAFQTSLLKLLKGSGVQYHSCIPISFGRLVFDYIDGKVENENLLYELSKLPPLDLSNFQERMDKLIFNETKNGPISFIDLGLNGKIFSYLERIYDNKSQFKLLHKLKSSDPFLEIISTLYIDGINLNWNFIGDQISDRFKPIFPYEMKETRTWIREKARVITDNQLELNYKENSTLSEYTELHSLIYNLWVEKSGLSVKTIHDNFFEIGGDSLKASKVIMALRRHFNMELDFEDLFDYPTIEKFVSFLNENLTIEDRLGLIWRKVLSVDEININDHFFEIGGHSLIANKLIQRIKNEFRIDLSFEDIFNSPIFFQLVQLLKNKEGNIIEKRTISKTETKTSYPLSSNQRRIYFIGQFENGSNTYNESIALRIYHFIDYQNLEKSIKILIKRHEILRTIFKENEDGEVNQYILEYHNNIFNLNYFDLNKEEKEVEVRIEEIISKESFDIFSFEMGPLLRVSLSKINNLEFVIHIVIHHIIVDSWSMNLFIEELFKVYSSIDNKTPLHLPKLDIQYKDYTIWELEQTKGILGQSNKYYWMEKLKAPLPLIDLPYDFNKINDRTYSGGIIEDVVSSNKLNSFKSILFAEKTTLFMGFLSAIKLLLFNLTGSEDIIIGSPIAGRDFAELETQLGFYANTLALRTVFDSKDSFKILLSKVKLTCLEAEAHKSYPFDLIVSDLNLSGNLNHNPIFEVALAFQNINASVSSEKDSTIQNCKQKNKGISKFDLTFDVFESEGELLIKLEYSNDYFLASTAKKLLNELVLIIDKIIEDPDRKLYEFCSVVSPGINSYWEQINNTSTEYAGDKSIIELFQEQVSKSPNKLGIITESKQLSYKDLDYLSNQFARYLKSKKGFETKTFVCILLEKSEWIILCILSILKLGKVYVPLQNDELLTRNKTIIADIANNFVVNEKLIKEFKNSIKNYSTSSLEITVNSNDLAYVMFTSGTTGIPKGVMIKNKSVVRLVKETNYLNSDEAHIILSTSDPSFDASTFEYWSTLLNGGTLILTGKSNLLDPIIFETKIIQHDVTTLWLTTGFANELIDLNIKMFSTLKYLYVGGELISSYHMNKLIKKYPNLNIYNMYGPTENTTFSLYYKIENVEENIPIGQPISNTTIFILDKQLGLVNKGIIGEIYLGGDGLSTGYLNNDELTNEKFIFLEILGKKTRLYKTGDLGRIRSDGNIEILGRNDDQIKLRGYRIETKEIENNLLTINGVASAVVFLSEGNRTEKILVGYIKLFQTTDLNEIKEKLKLKLPSYMIPEYLIPIESIPLTITGKVDKSKLTDIFNLHYSNLFIEEIPLTEMEDKISAVWCSVLGVEKLPIDKNFFELGGNSLLALKLISKLRKELRMKVSILDIYNNTIQKLAIKDNNEGNLFSFFKEFDQRKGSILFLPPIFGTAVVFHDMAVGLENEFNCYGVNYIGFEDGEKLAKSIHEMASNISIEYMLKLKTLPKMKTPFIIVGYSMGALVAFELAKILEAEGINIVLFLIDRSVKLSNEEKISIKTSNILLNNFKKQLDNLKINQIHFKEFYYNNCELINSYTQIGKIKGDIFVFESEGNEISENMSKWKDFSDNYFYYNSIKGNHWQALEIENVNYICSILKERNKL